MVSFHFKARLQGDQLIEGPQLLAFDQGHLSAEPADNGMAVSAGAGDIPVLAVRAVDPFQKAEVPQLPDGAVDRRVTDLFRLQPLRRPETSPSAALVLDTRREPSYATENRRWYDFS